MIRLDFFLAIGWVVYAGARRTVVVVWGGGGVLVPSVFISYIHVVCMQPSLPNGLSNVWGIYLHNFVGRRQEKGRNAKILAEV